MLTIPQIIRDDPRGTIQSFTYNGTTPFGDRTWKARTMSKDGNFLALMDQVFTTGDIRIFIRSGQTYVYHSNINTTVDASGDIDFAFNETGTKLAVMINNPSTITTTLYLYTRSGTSWGTPTSVDVDSSSINGIRVAMCDDASKIIVSDGNWNLGRGKIFHYNSSLSLVTSFVIEDSNFGNYKYHGTGLTITGDGLVIATTGKGSQSNAVDSQIKAFSWNGSTWDACGTATLVSLLNMTTTPTVKQIRSTYSSSTGSSDCKFVVGSSDGLDSNQSFAKIFYRNSSVAISQLYSVGLPSNSVNFGWDVDINRIGTMAYVSDHKKSYSGTTLVGSVYSWNFSTLTEFIPVDYYTEQPLFGSSICVDGDGSIMCVTGVYNRTSQFTLSL